jgi:hypothetical protein
MGVSWDQARAILEAGAATSDAIMKVRIPAAAGVTTDALNAVKIKATEMPSALSQLQDAANNLVEQGLDPASKAARDLQTAISEIQNRTIEVVTHYTSTGSPGSATSGGANPGAVGDNSGDSNTGAPVRGSVGMDQASGSSSSAPDTSQSALSDQSNRADLRKQGYAVGQNPDGTYYAEKRAAGGPVSAGSTYLVGEKGMELFRPASSGTIVPNGAWGGSHPIDYDKLGAAVAKALRQQPPVVAVEAVRSSLIKIGQRNGGTVGLA